MRFQNWDISGFNRDTAVGFYRNGLNPLVSVLLSSRGISSIDDARVLIEGDPSAVYDPFLLADMDRAVARINSALENGERFAIYGDYDVDGMTSCALLATYLRSKGADYEIYIPDRLDEGYGLNRSAIQALKSRGAGLIITVDCGITAIAEAAYAKSIGLSLVITDHHECRDTLPEADAVVDPKRPGCRYPNKALAGVGVAFKLVCALEGDLGSEEIFRRYGDLVAIGTIADVMPVTGENRELIRRGMKALSDTRRPGLSRLMRESFIDPAKLSTVSVGYSLAPRLNAAGRMSRAGLSVELLLTDSDSEAERLTAELSRLNAERRQLEIEIYEEAEAMMKGELPDGPIVFARRGWYQGVTGIVAAKMAERHLLPAIMISIGDDGVGRGSCRSFGSFGIHGALKACEDILSAYGGHEMAAGVTIAERDIDEFRRRVKEYYRENMGLLPQPGLRLDFEVEKPELLTTGNIGAMGSLEPFGSANPPPALCITGAALRSAAGVGSGKHTRFTIEKSGKNLECIWFGTPPESMGVSEGALVDVAFEPQINEFRGRSTVQLQILDIRNSVGM